MDKKIYIPKSGCKKVEFSNGGHLYRFSFHAETFQQFLAEQMRDGEFVNKGGYIAINISERREPSEWGDTHYATLDTFKPKPQTESPTNPAAELTAEDIPFCDGCSGDCGRPSWTPSSGLLGIFLTRCPGHG